MKLTAAWPWSLYSYLLCRITVPWLGCLYFTLLDRVNHSSGMCSSARTGILDETEGDVVQLQVTEKG